MKKSDNSPTSIDESIIIPTRLNHTAEPQNGHSLLQNFDLPGELDG
jgi:hypothetical protein